MLQETKVSTQHLYHKNFQLNPLNGWEVVTIINFSSIGSAVYVQFYYAIKNK